MENGTSKKDFTFDQIYDWSIKKAKTYCDETVLKQDYPVDGNLYCNATFDGYSCWNYTKAGTRVYGECPEFFIYEFGHTKSFPFKDCNKDGTWFRHPETNTSWSDYTTCAETIKVRRAHKVLYIYFSGYALSMVSLMLALCIFCCFRQLKCTRVSIHKNMFVSYILAAILWMSYYLSSALQPDVLQENPVWCRLLHILAQYATSSNYAWMFCEGLYLHTVLILAFINEKHVLILCIITGWVVPMIQTVIYFAIRVTSSEINKLCWHGQTNLQWIFLGPIALWLALNTFFLVNILRILCTKVSSMSQSNPLRHTLRATLILIPLLGIQYVAIPFRPVGHEDFLYAYNIVSAILVSFQGFFVSLLFCFFNGEVILLLKNQLGVHRQRKMSRSDTARSSMYFQLSNNNNASRPRLSICSPGVKTNDETGVKLVTETGVNLVTETKPEEKPPDQFIESNV
ncbi:calcitonin gene-related peptide type 1 receptor-like [Mytilus trossulus]|uniref:calcitonin gene-related peptide type 1 receptor-like n=1 Tax=Mytilus trossulus TaxID=6551 RepID=UPI0030053FBC